MYEDVHEPIQSLGEIRQEEAEKKQKLRDDNMNQALFLLSILSIFSALVDSYDFAAEFWENKVGSTATEVIQWGCIILIIGLAVKILINLLTAGKKKRSNLKGK
jgi:heme/copper-type cytochrome/quinol oxidase subunit 3